MAAAAADRLLLSKPCSLQGPDKAYADGTLYVYTSLARFVPKDGAGSRLELPIPAVKGEQAAGTSSKPAAGWGLSVDPSSRCCCTWQRCLQCSGAA